MPQARLANVKSKHRGWIAPSGPERQTVPVLLALMAETDSQFHGFLA
jgi:hypothetical protein